MTDEPDHDELQPGWPDDIVIGQEGTVRVFWIKSGEMQGLVDRLALVLSEHMSTGDELHVTYNAMQAGWQSTRRARARSSSHHSPAGRSCTSSTRPS